MIAWYWAVAAVMLAGLAGFGYGAMLSGRAMDDLEDKMDKLEAKAALMSAIIYGPK